MSELSPLVTGAFAVVLFVIMSLNIVGGRIFGSMIYIERETRPIFYWAIVAFQALVIAGCVWVTLVPLRR